MKTYFLVVVLSFYLDHTASLWSRTVQRAMIRIGFAAFPISLCWVFAKPVNAQHARVQRGDRGVRTPRENHKNIGFLCNTSPDPLKITKLPSQHSMLGHHRHASETPFQWRFAGGPMMARL